MSKHHHASTTYEIMNLVREVSEMSAEEMHDIYGIKMEEDETVFDEVFELKFATLAEWAKFTVEGEQFQDNKIYGKPGFDDEDYA